MSTAEILDIMQDGVLVKSIKQSFQQSFANSRNTRYNQDGVLVNSLRQRLQQSFANSRNTRYNVGWCFSQIINTKLTAIICQQQKC